MKQRWLVAIVGLPLLLAVLLACPSWATMLLVCSIAGIAAYELVHTVGKDVHRVVYAFTILCAVAQVLMIYSERKWYYANGLIPLGYEQKAPLDQLWLFPVVLVIALFVYAVKFYGTNDALPFSTLSAAVVGGALFPTMYSCITLLRMQDDFGRIYVLAPFFIAFAGDSISMYAGMLFGKRKMAPRVSPNKTWAGGIGGPIGSALGMLLLGLIGAKWLGYVPNYARLALYGAIANVFGQIGDLSMSMIKREHGIKDYSHLFLTHGGMLDRFDSTLFIAPVVYCFVSLGNI